ncbi:MAG: ABC transporter ATP-binding protein [Endomicrobium sp.]|jgi:iron complex transport system ATP-binding protein|nr:ABC transporter ATP-binding protein [Endomicrobium sp.]
MINIKNVSAGYFKNEQILKNIFLNIERKDFLGIIGKNGAGKSTLLKVLCNLIKPSCGTVCINNNNVIFFSQKKIAKIISFLPQDVDVMLPFNALEFIMFGRYPYMNIFKMPSRNDYIVVKKVMDFLDITSFAKKKIDSLSGGEKQKVLIAQALAQETEIIVFDELTLHLDIGSQNNVLRILKKLNERYNKTIILTLHDLNAASEFCNKLALMDNGKIYSYGTPDKVLNYRDIGQIYNTIVAVKTNPISNKPYIIPISDECIKV